MQCFVISLDKLFKEELAELMSCKYFTCLPSPPINPAKESLRANSHSPIGEIELKNHASIKMN